MRKVSVFLLLLPLILAFALIFPPFSHAQIKCSLETEPKLITSEMTSIDKLTLSQSGLNDNESYNIKISGPDGGRIVLDNQRFKNGKIVLENLDTWGYPEKSSGGDYTAIPNVGGRYGTFATGKFTVEVLNSSFFGLGIQQERKCISSFNVDPTPGNKCSMDFSSTSIKNDEDITMILNFNDPSIPQDEKFVTDVRKDKENGEVKLEACGTVSEYAQGVPLGKISENGIYYVSVWKYDPLMGNCSPFSGAISGLNTIGTAISTLNPGFFIAGLIGKKIISSAANDRVTLRDAYKNASCTGIISMPGFAMGANSPNANTMSGFMTFTGAIKSPCKDIGTSTKPVYVCPTAIGDINTDPTQFVKRIFGFLLGISGGIAVLLIINSGYQIMTSQGEPEKLQNAREQITSTIIGLVFIIFSLAVLQIIGVDLLQIPGFSK